MNLLTCTSYPLRKWELYYVWKETKWLSDWYSVIMNISGDIRLMKTGNVYLMTSLSRTENDRYLSAVLLK